MADILEMGDAGKIIGKLSGREFEGLVHSKDKHLDDLPEGKLYIVDIKAMEKGVVTESNSIQAFQKGVIPLVLPLQGEKYMVIDGMPRFNENYTALEDLNGNKS